MKNCIILLLLPLILLIFSDNAIAEGKIKQTRSYLNGSSVITITNSAAGKDQQYLKRLDKGNTYRNYKVFTPKKLEKIPFEEKPAQTSGIYSRYDVSQLANAHKVLGPIIISMSDGSCLDISPIIMSEAKKHNIDPILIKTVIKFESGFSPYAVSPAGAGGLMQLMPDTAAGLGVTDIFSPYQNIAGGVLYIRRQLDAFNNNVALALAAYNAGPAAVSAYGGIPPYQETINYVNGILADYLKSGRILTPSKPELSPKSSDDEPEPRNIDIFSTLTRMKKKTDKMGQNNND